MAAAQRLVDQCLREPYPPRLSTTATLRINRLTRREGYHALLKPPSCCLPLRVAAAIELDLATAAQPADLEPARLARAVVLLGRAAQLEHLG